MKAVLTLACVLAATTSSVLGAAAPSKNDYVVSNEFDSNMPQQGNNNTASIMKVRFRYMGAAARGWIQGYRRGMYKENNFQVEKGCFDQKTQDYLVLTFDTWGQIDFNWQDEILNLANALNAITDNCMFDESLYDWLSYCYEVEMCDPSIMMQTALKKVFQVTTVANDMAQLYGEGMPKETDRVEDIENFFERVGSNIGKLLRYASEFDPTLIPTQF